LFSRGLHALYLYGVNDVATAAYAAVQGIQFRKQAISLLASHLVNDQTGDQSSDWLLVYWPGKQARFKGGVFSLRDCRGAIGDERITAAWSNKLILLVKF